MKFCLITLFPDMLQAFAQYGVTGRAVKNGLLDVAAINPRDFATDKHRTVDDRPFGGGPGMLMKVEPLAAALDAAKAAIPQGRVVYLTPAGAPLTQQRVDALAQEAGLILLAGRYEGIDERLVASRVDEQISIGDYVLSGGELPALVLMDAVARRLPGVLGDDASAEQDSFTGDNQYLLDCPHYTRPEVLEGEAVPAVLTGGNHEAIRRWRLKESLGRTATRRPDLLQRRREIIGLTAEQEQLLAEYLRENQQSPLATGNKHE